MSDLAGRTFDVLGVGSGASGGWVAKRLSEAGVSVGLRKTQVAIQPFAYQDRIPGYGVHEMGVARLGKDPKTSVLSQYQQSWDVNNLFVMDAAGFTSGACQNPTLTIMALAARSTDFLLEAMRRGEPSWLLASRPRRSAVESRPSPQPGITMPSRGGFMRRSPVFVCLPALLACAPAVAQDVDLEVVHRIKQEAFERSQVMDHLFYLTDVNGPRLTNSPGYRRAAEWAARKMEGWGLPDAGLEPWGEFGRGWSLEWFEAHLVEPAYAPLRGVPLAWSGSTDGPQSGELIHAPVLQPWERDRIDTPRNLETAIDQYIARYRGKLRGRIVLLSPDLKLEPPDKPDSIRYDEKRLREIAEAPDPAAAPEYPWPEFEIPEDPEIRRPWYRYAPLPVQEAAWRRWAKAHERLMGFLGEEGVLAALNTDTRGSGALLFAEEVGAFWEVSSPKPLPSIVLQPESYSRIVRLLRRGVPVKMRLDVRTRFHEEDLIGYNVVGAIPGGAKKDEVVMVGGHLDSWHAGTGATDNAAGCAVALESVRILTSLGLPLDRTVRIALWGGEEQGLFGSRGYVARHFGDPVTMELRPEHEQLSGYFNLDNGGGKIRGVYLQGNEMMRPVFEGWLAPFADMGVTTISIRDTGGTDHLSFDAVGLPGFQFIQDPLDYDSRTHHSDLDVYDHVVPENLMQAAAVMATVVYHAANREERLPRKPPPRALVP